MPRAPILALQHQACPDYRSDIIQINSKSGLEGSNRNGAYAGSKFGGIGLTQSFALELVEDGIKVNSICPGFIVTPLADGGDPERTRQAFASGQPWPDYGQGENIAGAALFLASDDAVFVSGTGIAVDGGRIDRVW